MLKNYPGYLIVFTCFFILTSCAEQKYFQRIGVPSDFNSGKRSSVVLYTCPSVTVNVAVAGRKIGAWFGFLGPIIGRQADQSRNEEFLNLIVQDGIQVHARSVIENFIRTTLDETKIVSITDSHNIKCKMEDSTEQNIGLQLVDKDVLAFTTHLTFRATDDGDSLFLIITAQYSTGGSPRNVVWREQYVYETPPADLSSNVKPGPSTKVLFNDAFNILKPWIRKDLTEPIHWYKNFPVVSVKYASGIKEIGHLLQDADGLLVIRPNNGLIRVIPKKYVRNVNNVTN